MTGRADNAETHDADLPRRGEISWRTGMLIRLILLLSLVSLVSSCAVPGQLLKRPLGNDGELFLYCEPFPQDSSGLLEFTIEGVAAIREDGLTVPLKSFFSDFSQATLKRQRLFAQGVLPPGRYTAVAMKAQHATLTGEEGKGRLVVPEKGYENRMAFTVRSGKATVVTMALEYRHAVQDRIMFFPSFTGSVPPPPLPELTGYLTNHGENTITIFDRRSARIGGMIETGSGPAGLALDQLRLRAYVALSGEDAVAVLDLRENDIIDRVRLSPGDAPHGLALTPDGRFAVIANSGSNTASIVDALSRMEIGRVQVGNGPEFVLIDRNGRRAYLFNRLANSISVIDVATRLLVGTIPVDSGPVFGQFNRRGDRLYVFHDLSPNILVLNTDTGGLEKRITTGIGTGAVKVNSTTDQLYVGKRFDGIIDIYDPLSPSPIPVDFLDAGAGVGYLTIDGEEHNLVAIQPRSRLLRFINLVGKKERGLLDTGAEPYFAVMFGER